MRHALCVSVALSLALFQGISATPIYSKSEICQKLSEGIDKIDFNSDFGKFIAPYLSEGDDIYKRICGDNNSSFLSVSGSSTFVASTGSMSNSFVSATSSGFSSASSGSAVLSNGSGTPSSASASAAFTSLPPIPTTILSEVCETLADGIEKIEPDSELGEFIAPYLNEGEDLYKNFCGDEISSSAWSSLSSAFASAASSHPFSAATTTTAASASSAYSGFASGSSLLSGTTETATYSGSAPLETASQHTSTAAYQPPTSPVDTDNASASDATSSATGSLESPSAVNNGSEPETTDTQSALYGSASGVETTALTGEATGAPSLSDTGSPVPEETSAEWSNSTSDEASATGAPAYAPPAAPSGSQGNVVTETTVVYATVWTTVTADTYAPSASATATDSGDFDNVSPSSTGQDQLETFSSVSQATTAAEATPSSQQGIPLSWTAAPTTSVDGEQTTTTAHSVVHSDKPVDTGAATAYASVSQPAAYQPPASYTSLPEEATSTTDASASQSTASEPPASYTSSSEEAISTTTQAEGQPAYSASSSASAPASSGSVGASSDIKEPFLKAHNDARAARGVSALDWDDGIAQEAQAWADRCQFQHSNGTHGENLAMVGGTADLSGYTPEKAVQGWLDEEAMYKAGNTASSLHFTQVVWKGTTRVGCGKASCAAGSSMGKDPHILYVCQYDPRGNVDTLYSANVATI